MCEWDEAAFKGGASSKRLSWRFRRVEVKPRTELLRERLRGLKRRDAARVRLEAATAAGDLTVDSWPKALSEHTCNSYDVCQGYDLCWGGA